MSNTADRRRANVESSHYTHRDLWRTAQLLLYLGRQMPPDAVWPFLASSLFAYLAFEGFLNDLGVLLAPAEWAREREVFSRPPHVGTLGKFWFLAGRVQYSPHKGRRPFATIKMLEEQRHRLVHPRTETRSKTVIVAGDPPYRVSLEPDLYRHAKAAFVDRALGDTEAVAEALLTAAQRAYPKELRYYDGRAFEGPTRRTTTWIPYGQVGA